MKTANKQVYVLKISPQGQLTLPRRLREQLKVDRGSRITVRVSSDKKRLEVGADLPITKYFGTMGRAITGGRDAAEYIREMRDEDNRQRERKLGR